MEKEMAEMSRNIWFGAEAMATAAGDGNQTISAIASYQSGLRYNEAYGMIAGIIPDKQKIEGCTELESLMISQIGKVLYESGLSLADSSVRLVISTTKGNVALLEGNTDNLPEDAFLYATAKKVGAYFNAATRPMVISNACISGVSAMVVGRRLILAGQCDHVIVVGCDMLCEFITTGFASFKSISSSNCRPYDAARNGLNLGEACACVLLTSDRSKAKQPYMRLEGGSVTNDANHISGPSRTGDGLYYAISNAMKEAGVTPSDIGFVNTHGTATAYNDEMESKAVTWAELADTPLNSVKGYIGHTLGASGVVETLICLNELREKTVYGTYGFSEMGVPCPVNISSEHRPLEIQRCVKTASGFGGCNAAIVIAAEECGDPDSICPDAREVQVTAEYELPVSEYPFAEQIREEYRALEDANMKFFKMSDLCKAAYIAVENLLRERPLSDKYERTDIAVIMANSSASLDTDLEHQRILEQRLPEGTSPAVFVYTLPSVAAGEICIRNKFQGDNTFFIDDDQEETEKYAAMLIERGYAKAVICGWCDKLGENRKVSLKILEIK